MDVMKINSNIFKKLISESIATFIKKKFGYDMDIYLNSLEIVIDDTNGKIHIDTDLNMPKAQVNDILKKFI